MDDHRFPPDHGLSARMGITVFLLGLLYALFVAALLVLGIPLVLVVVLAVGVLGFQYWFSDRVALFSMGGHLVTEAQAPQLHAVVDRLCALADMSKPKVAIANSDIPNAFATGRSPSHAVLCVTTGLMRRLDENELEAVLAHELSHVAHRDVAVMTLAGFLGIMAGLLTRFALYAGLFGGFGMGGYGGGSRTSSRSRSSAGGGGQLALIELGVLVVSAAVYALSFLLIRTLSRYRELAADRAGAILIGRPSTLASALVKVTGDMSRIPTKDLRSASAFNAFYFAPIKSGSISALFATHPSLDKRLEQLSKLETQLDRPA